MPRTTLHIARISARPALDALRGEWSSLLGSSRANTLFLTWEWVSTWWEVYGAGSELHVLTARTDDGRLVGVAPLKCVWRGGSGLPRVLAAEFIGQGGDVTSEYLDFFAAPGFEETCTDAFLDTILGDPRIQVVDLRPLSDGSHIVDRLRRRLGRGRHLAVAPDSVCPILKLPPSVDAFLASRSKNYRKKMGEYERRCKRDLQVRLRISTSHEELQADMEALISLHHQRWNGQSRAFQSERYIDFHAQLARALLDTGCMRMFSLDSGAEPLARLYCFAYAGRFYYYQAGRNPAYSKHRLGLVLMHAAIQEAIKEGATVFDFLRGNEPYKYHWAQQTVSGVRLIYWKTLRARAAVMIHTLAARLAPASLKASFSLLKPGAGTPEVAEL
jgi:CelD/BcsL family acetyltransferase involved in cellulose biosynthesis